MQILFQEFVLLTLASEASRRTYKQCFSVPVIVVILRTGRLILCTKIRSLQWMKSYAYTLNWKRHVTDASFTILKLKIRIFFWVFRLTENQKKVFPTLALPATWRQTLWRKDLESSILFRSYHGHKQSYLRKIRVETRTVCQGKR